MRKNTMGDFGYNFNMSGLSRDVILATLGTDFPLIWSEYMSFATNPNIAQKYNPEVGLPYEVKSVMPPVGSTRSIIINGETHTSRIGSVGDIYIDGNNNLIQADWFEVSAKPEDVPAAIIPIKVINDASINMIATAAPSGVSSVQLTTEVIPSKSSGVAVITNLANDLTPYSPSVVAPIQAVQSQITNSQLVVAKKEEVVASPKKSKAPYIIGAVGVLGYFMFKE